MRRNAARSSTRTLQSSPTISRYPAETSVLVRVKVRDAMYHNLLYWLLPSKVVSKEWETKKAVCVQKGVTPHRQLEKQAKHSQHYLLLQECMISTNREDRPFRHSPPLESESLHSPGLLSV